MVVGTAVMGKPEENLGDSLAGFDPDLAEATVAAHLRNPFADPHGILQRATTRLVYDLFAYRRTQGDPQPQPGVVYTLARETHDADLAPGQQTKIQHSFSYSDGFGREIQKKIQAEPGPAPRRDAKGKMIVGPDGQPEMTPNDVNPRWVGNGWTVFNNKGKPVRQYEPCFTDTHRFEFDVRIGVSPVFFYDPAERVVATLHPNHTWEKVVFDPWRQETWDVNDTLLVADPRTDPEVGAFFRRLPDADYLPTWYAQRQGSALGPEEQAAARKSAVHANTPTVAHADSLGRTFRTVVHNRFKYNNTPPADPPTEEFYRTRVLFDIEDNQREVIDAKDRVVMRYDYDMLGNRVHQASMEAGQRWILNDVTGNPLYAWDSRTHRFRTAYDPLRRPTDSFLRQGTGLELRVGRTVYGETRPNPEVNNLRGKVIELFDQAGVVTSDDYDFKGNLQRSQRRLAREYKTTLDWSGRVPLDTETYTSHTRYDALNRPTELTTPDNSVIRPSYNEANLLERVEANLRGAAVANAFISDIDYDAKGQRTLIVYGNGVRTSYNYDPLTFRLVHLLTRRDINAFPKDCPQPPRAGWPGSAVQNLRYTYDPAGNITYIRDDAQQTLYFRNKRVEPSADYTYDAVYRLIEATGREHLGQAGAEPLPSSYNDKPRVGILLAAGDGNAMGRYLQRYVYDAVGNFKEMTHRGTNPANPGWTRTYAYLEPSQLEPGKPSNRLTSTTVGTSAETYSSGGDGYDAHGNMLRMPHLQIMQWDFKDQLQMTQRQAVNPDDEDGVRHQGERTWYVYDAGGQRVRKVTERQPAAGQIPTRMRERIYLGGVEIYREYENDGDTVILERETLHIMDDQQRVALVETRTQGSDAAPAQLIRHQSGNHLGSASLELDDQARIISYEEYYPYGSTSYQGVRSQTETPKRYRYTGKERDDETGFSYHGARYYAAWVGRWMSCDPAGLVDGVGLYIYARSNPVSYVDRAGTDSNSSQNVQAWKEEMRDELASLKADVLISQTSDDMEYLRADALTKEIDAQEAHANAEEAAMWPVFRKTSLWERFGNYLDLCDKLDQGDYNAPIVKAQNYSAEELEFLDQRRTFYQVTDTYAEVFWSPGKFASQLGLKSLTEVAKGTTSLARGAGGTKVATTEGKLIGSTGQKFEAYMTNIGVCSTTNCVNRAIALDQRLAGKAAFAKDSPGVYLDDMEVLMKRTYPQSVAATYNTRGMMHRALQLGGEGTRGIVGGLTDGEVGHAFNAVVSEGRVYFLDTALGGPMMLARDAELAEFALYGPASLAGYVSFRVWYTHIPVPLKP
jgi:RHS repeat-associated protein